MNEKNLGAISLVDGRYRASKRSTITGVDDEEDECPDSTGITSTIINIRQNLARTLDQNKTKAAP